MERSRLQELHFITAIANVKSILERGILSHQKSETLNPVSIAKAEVQERRAARTVPGGRSLHGYANLYLCARNPMLFLRRFDEVTVLQVNPTVLDVPGVVIVDGNAASDYVAFWPSPEGLAHIDEQLVFAEFWTDPDPIRKHQKTTAKCAETLVPDRVSPQLITGAYVSCRKHESLLRAEGFTESITVDGHMFFV